ncbi:hypothetical protein [Acinetobacter bereziniae]|uniref:hypothetical protein n=1 Tax=Acinetobacter bereziniae TaxID=106648 RepID=UPI0012502962|nr:hypothetical protein [Acinetobacter bereziniae]
MLLSKKDVVKHKSLEIEMVVVAVSKPWVTCEYADDNGERVEKVYRHDVLEVVTKNQGITMTEEDLAGL